MDLSSISMSLIVMHWNLFNFKWNESTQTSDFYEQDRFNESVDLIHSESSLTEPGCIFMISFIINFINPIQWFWNNMSE